MNRSLPGHPRLPIRAGMKDWQTGQERHTAKSTLSEMQRSVSNAVAPARLQGLCLVQVNSLIRDEEKNGLTWKNKRG